MCGRTGMREREGLNEDRNKGNIVRGESRVNNTREGYKNESLWDHHIDMKIKVVVVDIECYIKHSKCKLEMRHVDQGTRGDLLFSLPIHGNLLCVCTVLYPIFVYSNSHYSLQFQR